jgi:hypothetical protein
MDQSSAGRQRNGRRALLRKDFSPTGTAFLKESGHPLGRFLGDPDRGADSSRASQVRGAAARFIELILGRRQRDRAGLDERRREVESRVEEFRGRHNPVDQSPTLRLGSRDRIACQQKLARTAVANQSDQVVHHDRCNEPAPHLGIADPCRIHGDHEVAGHRQARAAGQGVAIERGDHRLGAGMDLGEKVSQSLSIRDGLVLPIGIGGCANLDCVLEVHPRAKDGMRASENDGTDRRVVTRQIERVPQAGDHRPGERIPTIGPVERDHGDRATSLTPDD